ncbi:hypothetical protein F2P79_006884 [Pimephales promelas]|nr:hypothetical protein F2P79_006884 [Pimephales promelas]
MTHGRKRKRTSAMPVCEETEREEAGQVPNIEILMLPDAVLSEILLHVVLEEGDSGLLNLSSVCSKFRSLVDTDSFRRRAHFCWLDSVTNWRRKTYQEYYQMYTLQPCRHCNDVYKNCLPGYVGRGKRGEIQGFYSENTHPGTYRSCDMQQQTMRCISTTSKVIAEPSFAPIYPSVELFRPSPCEIFDAWLYR